MKLNSGFIEYVKTHKITSIDLEAEAQDDKSIKDFAEALKVNHHINSLYLAECQISDTQLQILSQAIIENKSLRFIDLSANPITELGVGYLTEALKQNISIQVINLSYIELTSRSIELLNQSVLESSSITRVIPAAIMTSAVKRVVSDRSAWQAIVELTENLSDETPENLLQRVFKIAHEHYSGFLSKEESPSQTTKTTRSPGVFS